jgi:pimeloyl-ACP methyl ester carboxylesterase
VRIFVFIPGAWTGAWIWDRVAGGLRSKGHRALQITLPGLDEGTSTTSAIGLMEHVNHVLHQVNSGDPEDEVVLVAHDYGGIVAGMAAGLAPERVVHTVFVEAFLPQEGRSLLEVFPETQQNEELALIAANQGRWPAPDATVIAEGQDLTPEQADWIACRAVGHPGRTVTEPARLARPLHSLSATYVVCAMNHFDGRLSRDVEAMRKHWDFHTLNTGYWPMVSAPDDLAEILVKCRSEPEMR